MMELINLTPHDVVIITDEGDVAKTYPKSGIIPRVSTTCETVGNIDGVTLVATVLGEVEGLPEPKTGTVYIVSAMVRQAVSNRTDLVSPDTGPASSVRDAAGRIVGVKRFTR